MEQSIYENLHLIFLLYINRWANVIDPQSHVIALYLRGLCLAVSVVLLAAKTTINYKLEMNGGGTVRVVGSSTFIYIFRLEPQKKYVNNFHVPFYDGAEMAG